MSHELFQENQLHGQMLHRKSTIILAFGLFLVLNTMDLVADYSEGVTSAHIIHETVVVLFLLGLFALLFKSLAQLRYRNTHLKERLQHAREAARMADSQTVGSRSRFNDVVGLHFSDWRLSRSEAEVGRLLLKGLSLKEIADVRRTREKTVRAQASSIYRKAGLAGRHEFSAWFLEKLIG